MITRRRFLELLAALPLIGRFDDAKVALPKPKYEWICGPFTTGPVPDPFGSDCQHVIVYGQVRNTRTGRTVNWAKSVYADELQKKLTLWKMNYPTAADWSPEFRHVNADRDTINEPSARTIVV
jgi:hypothetical protein